MVTGTLKAPPARSASPASIILPQSSDNTRIGFPNGTTNFANVKELIITSRSDMATFYTSIIAGTATHTDEFPCSINFGTAGVIELARTHVGAINQFIIGIKGAMTLSNPGSLTLRVAPQQLLQIEARITGNGSVVIERKGISWPAACRSRQ